MFLNDKPDGIDLRNEIQEFLDEHGYYVIVVRDSPKGRRIERHKVFSMGAAVPETLPRLLQLHQIGMISSSARLFYFKHTAYIRQGDWIFNVEIDKFGRVTYVGEMFKVNYVEPYRDHRGRIEFLSVAADREQGGGPDVDLKRTAYIRM